MAYLAARNLLRSFSIGGDNNEQKHMQRPTPYMTPPTQRTLAPASRETKLPSDAVCRLLTLPAELRSEIWELVVASEGEILVPCASPPLLQTCHQIRWEGRVAFFSGNTFHILPQMQDQISQQLRERSTCSARLLSYPSTSAVATQRVFEWLQQNADVLCKIRSLHVTIGIVPVPRYHVPGTEFLIVLDHENRGYYVEWLIDLRPLLKHECASGTQNVLPAIDAACQTCEALGDRFQDRSQSLRLAAGLRRRAWVDREPAYQLTGLHAHVPGCTIHGAFGFEKNIFGDALKEETRTKVQRDWLAVVVPHVRRLVDRKGDVGGAMEHWRRLIEGMEKAHARGLAVSGREDEGLDDSGRRGGGEVFAGLEWRSFEVDGEGWELV